MATSLITKDTHPAKDFTGITQIGIKAYNLALAHKEEIDPRLPGTANMIGAPARRVSVSAGAALA